MAHAEDVLAARVYLTLCRRRGPGVVRFVSDAELVFAGAVTLQLESHRTRCRLRLADGFPLDGDRIGVVFNRLRGIAPQHLEDFGPGDRAYAGMELNALWLAWLAALPVPVLNPATARGLCGPQLSTAEWLTRAAGVGLPVRGWRFSSNRRRGIGGPGSQPVIPQSNPAAVIDAAVRGREPRLELEPVADLRRSTVIGRRVLGMDHQRAALLTLAQSLGCDLVQVSWQRRLDGARGGTAQWCVCEISAVPDSADQEVVEAVSDRLLELAQEPAW